MMELINNYFSCDLSLKDFNNCKEFYYTPAELIELAGKFRNENILIKNLKKLNN